MNNALRGQGWGNRLDCLIDISIMAVVFFLPISLDIATYSLVAGTFCWVGKMIWTRKREIGRLPHDHLLALLVFFGLTSILVSPDRFFSFYNYSHLMGRYVLLYYLVSHNVRSLPQIKRLIGLLLASSIVVALYGFYQYIIGVDISAMEWVDVEKFPDLKVRVFSTMQNPNLLAGFLVTIISMSIGLGLQINESERRLSMLIVILFLTACLVLTYSRGAWVSLAVVISAYGLLFDRRILWLLIVAPIAMLCISDVAGRITSIVNPTDTSSTLRLALWHSTLAMIANNPLAGIGWGAYWLVYPEYDFFIQDPRTVIFHAHNMYLHLAAEIGIPGLCAFIAFMYCHAHTAIDLVKQPIPRWVTGFVTGLGASILGLAVSGLTDHILFSIQMSMISWLLLALIIAVRQAVYGIDPKKSYAAEKEKLRLERNT